MTVYLQSEKKKRSAHISVNKQGVGAKSTREKKHHARTGIHGKTNRLGEEEGRLHHREKVDDSEAAGLC